MKKLAYVLPVLVVIAGIVFLAVHRREKKQHIDHEIREAAAGHFTFDQQMVLARAACAGGEVSADAKKQILCSVCPVGSDFASPSKTSGSETGWRLDAAQPGSFTSAKQDEALLHVYGCESHARNFGGVFLMRRTDGQWSALRYAPAATVDDKCQKLPWPTGREALVCKITDMHQGYASDDVQLLLFDEKAPVRQENLANTFFLGVTDESANCGFEASTSPKPHMMQFAKINGFEVLPEAEDGNRNVAIDATIDRVLSAAKPGAGCPAGHPQAYHLVFDNQGDHFDAGEGYIPVHALKREDCCELTVNPKVYPAKY